MAYRANSENVACHTKRRYPANMVTMILAHPRSKSTLMADCFLPENYLGEIFNLNVIDKKQFVIKQPLEMDPTPLSVLWKQEWAEQYLKYLEWSLKQNPKAVFKVFFEHIIDKPEAIELIKSLSPRVLFIMREDSLAAVKSFIIATKQGFSFNEQISRDGKIYVSPALFAEAYRRCVLLPKLAREIFKPDWETTYESFDPQGFSYSERTPVLKKQDSSVRFSQLSNEEEVDRWFQLLHK